MKKNRVDIVITIRGSGKTYHTKKDILKHMYLKNGMSYDMLENAYYQACRRIRQLEIENIEYKGRIDRAVNYIDAYTFLVKRENIKNILKGE